MNSVLKTATCHETLTLTQQVLDEIQRTVGSRKAECGGVLGADEMGNITHYYFDETGIGTEDSYEPDVENINAILTNHWLPTGIRMVGIIHSHAAGRNVPSCGDIHYGMRILQALEGLTQFHLPIVTQSEKGMEIHAFIVEKNTQSNYVCRKIAWEVNKN